MVELWREVAFKLQKKLFRNLMRFSGPSTFIVL